MTNLNLNYLNQKELCQRLRISPNTAKKEIAKAINNGCNAVIKIGKSYRINYDMFILWINKRNRDESNKKEGVNNKNKDKNISNKNRNENINNKNANDSRIINNQRIREVREQWEKETKTQRVFTKGETFGGFIIPKEESNIASQLRRRIFKGR